MDKGYQLIEAESGVPIKAWTKGVAIEAEAEKQLRNVARLPFIYKWVAAMPDVHWGIGATVGSVIPTKGAIIPAAVGVDIGCGMMAVQTTLNANQLPDNLQRIRTAIEKAVPHGRTDNGGRRRQRRVARAPEAADRRVASAANRGYKAIIEKYPKLDRGNDVNHLGTLGTGNHFIEVCLDESDQVWFMLHSGSRGVGNRIGMFFIEMAKNDMRQHIKNLPDKDLAYFEEGSEHFEDYVDAVSWAQEFAHVQPQADDGAIDRRRVRVGRSAAVFVDRNRGQLPSQLRRARGALRSRRSSSRAKARCARAKAIMGIIPGSMGARSYIVRGLGNPESFHSCSHGAGRAMSRNEAKRRFTIDDHIKATAGVECRKDADVIDETPMAYKPIEDVMNAQKDLVEIVHTLRQVVCVKG